jgi:hypothetical protein
MTRQSDEEKDSAVPNTVVLPSRQFYRCSDCLLWDRDLSKFLNEIVSSLLPNLFVKNYF